MRRNATPLPLADDRMVAALAEAAEAKALEGQPAPAVFTEVGEDLSPTEVRLNEQRAHDPPDTAADHLGESAAQNHEWLAGMMQASPAYFAHEVLSGPPGPPYNGKFLVSEHHEQWDDLITQFKRLCIEAARDHGKCQPGETLVLAADGRRIRLDRWRGGYVLAYDPDRQCFTRAHAPAAQPNGVRQVLRVTTRSGRRTTVTENHPLRTLDSWVEAQHIRVGMRIAAPYWLPGLGRMVVEDAWSIGLLVGDGGFTGSNVTITTADRGVLRAVRRSWGDVKFSGQYDYRLSGWQRRARALGLWRHGAYEKRVPQVMFLADDQSIAEFIAGYLDADAHVNFRAGGSVEFYSVAELLLRDVQHLLIRLGVLSVLTPKRGRYHGQAHRSWRLTIRGKDILRVQELIRPRGQRAAQLRQLAGQQRERGRCSGAAVDRYPREVWAWVQHTRHWFARQRLPRPAKKYAPTREKLAALAEAEGNARLAALAAGPVFWDEVVKVERLGEQPTWGLCVPGLANYVADDLVSHNTYFFDFAYPLWKLAMFPGSTGFIFSGTAPQAIRILGDIKEEIETNPRLQWLLPTKRQGVQWSSTCIQCSNGSRIYARGFGTRVRGAHPDWIVVDDGLNDETLYSEMVRRKQIDYFYSAISNMLVPGGQLIVVGTPFHQQDLYADLEANKEYVFRRFAALNGEGQPLWPERYSAELLAAKRREIGGLRFTREFMCQPIADDMSLFPGYLFEGEGVEQPTVCLGMPLAYWRELGITSVAMGVDFALSTSAKADYSVIWVMGRDAAGNRWIMDIARGHGASFQSQLSKIIEVARLYEPGIIFVESNQAQQIFGDELIRTTDLPIHKFVTGVQKHALDKGVPSLRVLLENRKFKIPRGDERSVRMTNVWRDEMRAFTWAQGKLTSVISHDDTVMACWIAEQAVRHGGFSFDFGDDLGYDSAAEQAADMKSVMRELTGEGEDGEHKLPPATGNLVDDVDAGAGGRGRGGPMVVGGDAADEGGEDPWALPTMKSGDAETAAADKWGTSLRGDWE